MSLLGGRKLLSICSPVLQTIRHRTRAPNLKKPAVPHWLKAVATKLTEPKYVEKQKLKPLTEKCNLNVNSGQNNKEENPFEAILSREFMERLTRAKLVGVFHRHPMTAHQLFTVQVQLRKNQMEYLRYNNNIVKLALKGTKYEAMLKLYESCTSTVVCDEPLVKKLLQVQKRIPSLELLGAYVDGRLMSITDLQWYASLPHLHALQSELVGILGTPSQRLSQNLSYHQSELSSLLERYVCCRDESSNDVLLNSGVNIKN